MSPAVKVRLLWESKSRLPCLSFTSTTTQLTHGETTICTTYHDRRLCRLPVYDSDRQVRKHPYLWWNPSTLQLEHARLSSTKGGIGTERGNRKMEILVVDNWLTIIVWHFSQRLLEIFNTTSSNLRQAFCASTELKWVFSRRGVYISPGCADFLTLILVFWVRFTLHFFRNRLFRRCLPVAETNFKRPTWNIQLLYPHALSDQA